MIGALSAKELEFEQTGDFRALIAGIPRRGPDVTWRRLAALARAHAFSREFAPAQEILAELRAHEAELDPESRVVVLLTESLLHRFGGRFEEAIASGQAALALAKKNLFHELIADAQFGVARAVVEQGWLFLGSDLFQRIHGNPQVSAYRRGLALSNWVWVLWDLGRADEVKALLPQIPPGYRFRHELCFSMLDGDLGLARSWIENGLPPEANMDQSLYLAQSLVVACAVLGKQELKEMLAESWVPKILLAFTQSQSFLDRTISRGCLKWIGTSVESTPETFSPSGAAPASWRSELEADFLEFLWIAQRDPAHAVHFYAERVNPAFIEQWWLKTPLIPRLTVPERGEAYFSEDTPWSRALARLLNLGNAGKTRDLPAHELQGYKLIYREHGLNKELDLSKSPTSIRLLKILAHGNKSEFTKKELHQNLTASAYLSDIHDPRLFKLLTRLEKRLQGVGIPAPWHLPGNNRIVLRAPIRFRQSNAL